VGFARPAWKTRLPILEANIMAVDSIETEDLLRRAGQDEASALGKLLEGHRPRLRRMVSARLDRRLAGRVDPSDVVQEALADAGVKLPEYLRTPVVPFHAWLRRLTFQRLVWWHRAHLGARKRSAARERLDEARPADERNAQYIDRLAGTATSPSQQAVHNEERLRLLAALDAMAPGDRTILELRYCEGLPFDEIAARLEIRVGAAKMRHLRALERLRSLLGGSAQEPSRS
jgi:RNA polymerase sigma-70 factor (ECF subfamily)